jgi:signal transduction histidine kinase
MAVIAGAAIAMSTITVISQLQNLEEATIAQEMTYASKATLDATDALRREYGAFELLRSTPGAKVDGAAFRATTDRRFEDVVDALNSGSSDATAMVLSECKSVETAIRSLRATFDAALAAPASEQQTTAESHFSDEFWRQIDRLDEVASQLGAIASNNAKPLTRNLLEITRLATEMRNLGVVRAKWIDGIVTSGSASASQNEQSADLTGRLNATWHRVQELAKIAERMRSGRDLAAANGIDEAIEATRHGYFETLERLYDEIIEANHRGVSIGLTPSEVFKREVVALNTVSGIRDAAAGEAIAVAARGQHSARLLLVLTIGLLVLAATVAVLSVLVLQRRVLAPISVLTRTVFRLADNDRDLEVPELARHDEVGDLARAIETLRGNAEHAAGLERDRQSMEIQLRQAQKLEALGTLAGGIAHEINTPAQYVGDNMRFLQTSFAEYGRVLAAYVALGHATDAEPRLQPLAAAAKVAEAAADLDFLTAEIPAAIAQSLDGIDRIRQIVLAVKEFSHPDVKEVAPLDLNRAIDTTITVTRNQWKYIAEMATDFATDLPEVPCRGGEINQMLLNLIVNAAHAIEAKGQGTGTITVATARRDGWAEIRVSDTGTGIPPALIDRIFDPFFTTKEPGKGSGQGLAICHNIVVTKHGGSIAVESTLGEGSCFIVRLPLEAPAMPADLGIAA